MSGDIGDEEEAAQAKETWVNDSGPESDSIDQSSLINDIALPVDDKRRMHLLRAYGKRVNKNLYKTYYGQL